MKWGYSIVVLLCFLHSGFIHAQTWVPVKPKELTDRLDASTAKFKALSAYHVVTTLKVFRKSSDKQPMELGVSEVWKVGDKAKAEHLGLVSYQNASIRVTIDPEDQLIMVTDPTSISDIFGSNYQDTVFAQANIGRSEQGDGVHYRAMFGPGSDYEMIEFRFDGNGWLRQMDTHWGNEIVVEPDNFLSDRFTPMVRMEMELPERIKPGMVDVDPSVAVLIVNGSLVATQPFRDYDIIDNRVYP